MTSAQRLKYSHLTWKQTKLTQRDDAAQGCDFTVVGFSPLLPLLTFVVNIPHGEEMCSQLSLAAGARDVQIRLYLFPFHLFLFWDLSLTRTTVYY